MVPIWTYSNNLANAQRTGVHQEDPEYIANAKMQYQPAIIRNKVIAVLRFLKCNSILYETRWL
jgi:hypothetical protein